MLELVLFCLSSVHFYSIAAQGECTDLRGRLISHGFHYAPGPDTCTLCVCDNGLPKVCKAVLCSPPQDCRSFRVGNTCCEFICLDDVVKPTESEAKVRVAAAGTGALVLVTIALVVYHTHKRRRPPRPDDQRSLTSIGYISGSMGYMGGTCETALGAWKPPSNYLPRGEAPPPYDEAVAQCRSDSIRMNNESFHRSYTGMVDNGDAIQCTGHAYINIPRPVQQIANTQNCYNAPLLQSVHPPDAREPAIIPHHPLAPSVLGFPSTIRLTGSLGTISGRGLQAAQPVQPGQSGQSGQPGQPGQPVLPAAFREPEHERPHNVPGFYTHSHPLHTSLHRTIPRISTALDTSMLESMCGFSRADRSLCGEIRRSFHRAGEPRLDTGRSVPRNLNMAVSNVDLGLDHSGSTRLSSVRSRAQSEEQNVGGGEAKPRAAQTDASPPAASPALPAPPAPPATPGPPAGPATPAPPAPPGPQPTLPLTVDKPSCVCSYDGTNAPGNEDADDYRNECENCKSASSSRWVSEEGGAWCAVRGGAGTQTLQRAPPPAPPPPATATLPQPVTKSRTVVGPPSNWENWFNTIPDSDTESEEE